MVNYSQARANLAGLLDGVVDDAEEVVIHRSGHEPVVVVSLAEWESIKETEYLLSNPAMARHLRESIAELDAGRGEVRELVDPASVPEVG
jgi:antitoxin YefM